MNFFKFSKKMEALPYSKDAMSELYNVMKLPKVLLISIANDRDYYEWRLEWKFMVFKYFVGIPSNGL